MTLLKVLTEERKVHPCFGAHLSRPGKAEKKHPTVPRPVISGIVGLTTAIKRKEACQVVILEYNVPA